MNKLFLLFLFPLFCSISRAQNTDTLYWTPERKLVWDDFKGAPDTQTNLLAMTYAGIGFQLACENDKLKANIFCYFNQKNSWTKDKESEYLLRHEQLHFDLTELYTRKLRQRINEVSDPCGKNFGKLNNIYQVIFTECENEQNLYDKESNHSMNKQKQQEWELQIAKDLKTMEKFAK